VPLAKFAWSGQKQDLRGAGRQSVAASEHDPEKRKPVFGEKIMLKHEDKRRD
jgi:hypothetical protein